MADVQVAEVKSDVAPAGGQETKTDVKTEVKGNGQDKPLGVTGGTDKPITAPADFPADWREKLAGDDGPFLAQLKRYQSPQNFAKSWRDLREKTSVLPPPRPETDDEEAVNKWRAQVGLPEKAEGYLENLPKGLVIGETDKPRVTEFITAMHAKDVPPAVVHETLNWYYQQQEKAIAERQAADQAHRQTAEDELRQEWGNEFRPNLTGVHSLFDTYGEEGLADVFYGARTADGTPLGDHPAVLKFLVGLSREINPAGTLVPSAAGDTLKSLQGRINEIRQKIADKKSDYWTNESLQEEYRALLGAEDRMKARQK